MTPTRSFFRAGFTLVEVLVGIAVVGLLSSAGYVSVVNIRESAAENKLKADVSSLNKATQVYLASGGEIPESASVGLILEHLKMRAPDEVEARLVGMTGSFIDPRVHEAQVLEGASGLRAVWVWNKDPARQRFHLVESGEGFRFEFKDPVAPDSPDLEPERDGWRTVKLAASDMTSGNPVWIWDGVPNEPSPISTPPPLPGSGTSTSVAATPPTKGKLDPPTIDISGGTFSLMQLASLHEATAEGTFTIKVTNPNSPTISDLSSGSSVVISPGESGFTFSSTAISKFPAVWGDSDPAIQTYAITPFDLEVAITDPGALTPFDLGVPRASGVGSSASATATISNWSDIPDIFKAPAAGNLELVMAVGSGDPSGGSGSTQQSVETALTTNSGWNISGQTPTLVVSAMAKSGNSTLFNASPVSTQTLTATKGTLTLDAEPASGDLNASQTVTLKPADLGNFPNGYIIKYTTDGSDPRVNGVGFNPASPIIPPADGDLVINAIALPPAGLENWFESEPQPFSYTVPAQQGTSLPNGVLVASANFQNNIQLNGSMTYAPSTPSDLTIYGSARIKGNLYVPGLPDVYDGSINSGQWYNRRWSLSNEALFTDNILGKQFNEQGVEINPPDSDWRVSPRVEPPDNAVDVPYNILLQENVVIEGKIYRGSPEVSLPVVELPRDKNGNIQVGDIKDNASDTTTPFNSTDNTPPATVYSSSTANVVVQMKKTVTLMPGNYGDITAGVSGAEIVLGNSTDPNETQYYTFESISLSSGAKITLGGVGKVVIIMNTPQKGGTWKNAVEVHNSATFGDWEHPERLQLRFYAPTASVNSTDFLLASSARFSGQIVAPTGKVTLQEGSVFTGSVTAYHLHMTGNAGANIDFTLPPLTTLLPPPALP